MYFRTMIMFYIYFYQLYIFIGYVLKKHKGKNAQVTG